MRRFVDVARGVAWRQIHNFTHNPAFLLPSIIFPLFFFTAFAGGLSSVSNAPGFDFPSGYTAFQFVFVLLQSAAFGGVFTGFAVAADFERGFARRLMLAAPNRLGILAGYLLAGLVRALIVGVLLFVVALLVGMQVDGGVVDLFGLIVLALIVNLVAALFAFGVAFRLRTIQAGPAMQMPVFLDPLPRPGLRAARPALRLGRAVAKVNPFTALVEGGRDLISGQSFDVLVAYGCVRSPRCSRSGRCGAAEGRGGRLSVAAAPLNVDGGGCGGRRRRRHDVDLDAIRVETTSPPRRRTAPTQPPLTFVAASTPASSAAAGSRACGRSSRGGTRSSSR